MFELILEHYYIDYTVIDGYAFDEGFNTNISDVTKRLYVTEKNSKLVDQRSNSSSNEC
jgi:hypothetical protein